MKDVRLREKKIAFWQNKKVLTGIMGLFIISIMVFSVLYYGLDSTGQENVEYQGLKFIETNQGWQAYTKDDVKILLLTDPGELENVSFADVSLSFLTSLQIQKIYLSFDPEADVSGALYDFQRNIALPASLIAACYEESELCKDSPIKTCADATLNTAVILFKEANETAVTLEGNCLTVEGKNLLSVVDKLIVDQYGER